MPPRPRPKPKVRPGSSSQPLKEPSLSQDEEDSIFIKSGNLTTAAWKQMNQMPSAHESYEHYDSDGNENQRKTVKKLGGKDSITERVGSHSGIGGTQPLYIDDSDDEHVPPVQFNTPSTRSMRPQSRSRSITPPPELALEQRIKARNLVRQALGVSDRRSVSPQPTCFDSLRTDDSEAFDPELASIALRSTNASGSFPSRMGEDDHPHEVVINVRWRNHPSGGGQNAPNWTFRAKRSDNLRHIFKEVADSMGVLPDNVVLALRGHRVYSSVSPAALGIWSDGEFAACLEENYELLRDSRLHAPPALRAMTPECEESGDGSSDTGSTGDVAEDTFKLTIRSVKTPKGIVLTVRPQTKCGAIVKAYLRKAGLANEYLGHDTSTKVRNRGKQSVTTASGPQLVVDGDKLDNEAEIREADVEDGDIIEVTSL